jgi:hypothetical protein
LYPAADHGRARQRGVSPDTSTDTRQARLGAVPGSPRGSTRVQGNHVDAQWRPRDDGLVHTERGFVREVYAGLDAVLPLGEIGVELPLAEIYETLEFAPKPPE